MANKIQPENDKDSPLPKTKLFLFRSFVFCSLLVTTCICGVCSYIFLQYAEDQAYNTQYESVTSQLRDSLQDSLHGAESAANELAGLLSIAFPDASQWPFTYIEGYDEIFLPMAETDRLDGAATTPIITPEQVPSFVGYVSQTYKNDQYISPAARAHPYEYGVFAFDDDFNFYLDYTGVTPHSEYNFLTPFLNVGDINRNFQSVLYNMHSSLLGATAVDASYECGVQLSLPCAVLTDVIVIPNLFPEPTSLLSRAVYPLHDPETLVGFQTVAISWRKMLTGLVPDYVCGIEVVLTTDTLTLTYHVCDGFATLKCSNDCSDSKFSSDRVRFPLLLRSTEAEQPTPYTVELYPSQDFYDIYHSDTPWIAAVAAVVVIFLTSLVFVLYDFMVKQESQARTQVLEAKRRFVRFVSHEIRTPLNTLVLGLKLLLDSILKMGLEGKQEKELIKLTNELQGSTDVAVLILNDLLQYDKIETGNLKLELTDINIWDFIAQNVHLFEGPAAEKNVQLREALLLPEEDNEIRTFGVFGDPLRIAQVIGNLISNALKFSSSGSTVTVTSSYHKESHMPVDLLQTNRKKNKVNRNTKSTVDCWMIFTVQDEGPGISEENLKLLFGEGVQFNPNTLQSGQGSGLGLWISKGIVELHGGNIWATSEGEGQGCTFNFELPLVKQMKRSEVDVEEKEKDSENKKIEINVKKKPSSTLNKYLATETVETESGETKKSPWRVLVVDDVPMCRRMLGRSLEMRGFEYKEAEDGKVCVQMIKSGEVFDCILMDFQMPLQNGPDATRELKKFGCEIPVVGVTGNVLSDDVKEFMDAGASLVLQKPFDMDAFEEFMKNRELFELV